MSWPLEVRFHEFADLYMLLRFQAVGDLQPLPQRRPGSVELLASGDPWDEAVAAMRQADAIVREAFERYGITDPGRLEYQLMGTDHTIAACSDIEEVAQINNVGIAAALPHLRQAVTLAEPLYAPVQSERRKRYIRAAEDLVARLQIRRGTDWTNFLLGRLEERNAKVIRIVVVPVGNAPWSVLAGLDSLDLVVDMSRVASGLTELLLRHAYYTFTGDIVMGVEAALSHVARARGVDLGWEAKPALVRAHSAECVRRFVDPDHVDLGESDGFFDSYPQARTIRRIWVDCLAEQDAAGRSTIRQAVEDIVAELARHEQDR